MGCSCQGVWTAESQEQKLIWAKVTIPVQINGVGVIELVCYGCGQVLFQDYSVEARARVERQMIYIHGDANHHPRTQVQLPHRKRAGSPVVGLASALA